MGAQNIAVKVRGSALFLDYHENPAQAAKLLDISRGLIQASVEYFLQHGVKLENVWQPNCTVLLIGPASYGEWLLPHDRALHRFAQQHGLPYAMHHCGHFDQYASLYRQVGDCSGIEVGWGSDLRLALDVFPEASIQYIIGHQFVWEGPASAVRERMRALIETAGPDIGRVSFNIPDMEYGTPDDHVRAIVEGLLPDAG